MKYIVGKSRGMQSRRYVDVTPGGAGDGVLRYPIVSIGLNIDA